MSRGSSTRSGVHASRMNPCVHAVSTFTAGKNPANPWLVLTSETAESKRSLVDSTLIGPKDPNAAPNCCKILLLRNCPPTERVVIKGGARGLPLVS